VQTLASHLLKIALVFLALLIGLNAVGIDLTAFTVFSGAIGIGLGFGLQKIVSNLVSGSGAQLPPIIDESGGRTLGKRAIHLSPTATDGGRDGRRQA
jgi:hypothetical protein